MLVFSTRHVIIDKEGFKDIEQYYEKETLKQSGEEVNAQGCV